MKIYLLIEYDYDGTDIHGVFLSKEKAEHYLKFFRDTSLQEFDSDTICDLPENNKLRKNLLEQLRIEGKANYKGIRDFKPVNV